MSIEKFKYPPWSNIYYRKKELRKGIKDLSKKYVKSSDKNTLVDYGCGEKPYKDIFEGIVDEYIGLDMKTNDTADRTLDKNGTSNLKKSVADILLSTQVLEHVPEPSFYLKEARRIMKEDGILILSTHGHFFYHPVPEDYWRWTHEGLRKELRSAGFEIQSMRGIVGKGAVGAQFILNSLQQKVPGLLSAPFNLFMQWVIQILDSDSLNPHRDEDASIFLVVARKSSEHRFS